MTPYVRALLLLPCLFLLAVLCPLTRANQILPYEPVEHINTHLPKEADDITKKLDKFLSSSTEETSQKTGQIEKKMKALLKKTHMSATLLHEMQPLAQRLSPGLQFNSSFLLPHGIILPIISTSLPILLESYKPDILFKPMGTVLKGEHKSDHRIKDYLSLSLFDILTKLPQSTSTVDLDDSGLLPELDRRGEAAFYYVTTVLDNVAKDAWKDVLISVAMERSAFSDKGQMITSLEDISHYSSMLAMDLTSFSDAPLSDTYPLDAGHYLFGWWVNCPRKRKGQAVKCLVPYLPANTLIVINPAIRIYCIPRLNMHIVIGHIGSSVKAQSMRDVIEEDERIWKQIYSVVDPKSSKKASQKVSTQAEESSVTQEPGPIEQAPEKPIQQGSQDVEEQKIEPQGQGAAAESTARGSTPPPSKKHVPTEPPAKKPQTTASSVSSAEENSKSQDPAASKTTPTPKTQDHSTKTPSPAQNTPTIPSNTAPPATPASTEDEVLKETTDTLDAKAARREAKDSEPTTTQDGKSNDPIMDEGGRGKVEEEEEDEEGKEETNKTVLKRAIYVGWPIAVFMFYTIFSHVWIYWVMHLLWIVVSTIFPGVHLPRPKTSKQD